MTKINQTKLGRLALHQQNRMGCRNLSKFGTIFIQFLYLPRGVVKWWDKILRYSVSVFPVLMLQECSICIRFIISAALSITGGWDAIGGHFEGSSRDWPTNRDHDNWSLMVTENHTKAWNDDRAVMTLQIVICNLAGAKQVAIVEEMLMPLGENGGHGGLAVQML